MSYISRCARPMERDRGSVSDLHAQLLPQGVPDTQAERPGPRPGWWWVRCWPWAGGAWFVLGRDGGCGGCADGFASGAVAAAMPASAASAPAVPPSAPDVAPAPAPAAAVAAPAPAPRPRPATKRPAADDRATAAVPRAAARPPAPPPPPPAAPAPPPAPPPAARLPGLGELPGELRQQIPPLVIGGSVYSPQASARMVIVNGQVFQEGSSLTPELKLEQVRQKAAVFSIRGQLFEVPF